jgi:hypothetical protein
MRQQLLPFQPAHLVLLLLVLVRQLVLVREDAPLGLVVQQPQAQLRKGQHAQKACGKCGWRLLDQHTRNRHEVIKLTRTTHVCMSVQLLGSAKQP